MTLRSHARSASLPPLAAALAAQRPLAELRPVAPRPARWAEKPAFHRAPWHTNRAYIRLAEAIETTWDLMFRYGDKMWAVTRPAQKKPACSGVPCRSSLPFQLVARFTQSGSPAAESASQLCDRHSARIHPPSRWRRRLPLPLLPRRPPRSPSISSDGRGSARARRRSPRP